MKHDDEIEAYFDKVRGYRNDTTYTMHGMLVKDERYKGETSEVINMIKNDNNLDNDQAYYLFYFTLTNNMTYEEAKEQLLSSQEFEQYQKNKKARRSEL